MNTRNCGTANCIWCGAVFERYTFRQVGCCEPCTRKASEVPDTPIDRRLPRGRILRDCERCGEQFVTTRPRKKFCEAYCSSIRRDMRLNPEKYSGHPCARCGRPCPPDKRGARRRKFCSQECAAAQNRDEKPDRWREQYRFAQYGITKSDHDAMLEAQGGVCAICGTDDPASKSGAWHIDHCHDTGAVRGLLCTRCNTGIGSLRDNLAIAAKAVWYLANAQRTA